MKDAPGISLEGSIIEEFLNSPMTLRRCGQFTSAVKNQQLLSVGVYYFLTKPNHVYIFNPSPMCSKTHMLN